VPLTNIHRNIAQSVRREIKRGCEEEREGSPVHMFSPPSFEIVRMLVG